MFRFLAVNRRQFIHLTGGAALSALPAASITGAEPRQARRSRPNSPPAQEWSADVVIAGGGLGGCAAALAALRNGLRVIMTEETDWIGGQLTQQGVPPDEHRWIETHGATAAYRDLRMRIRRYYRDHYPLTATARAREALNPGNGNVSRLCHEPRVALAALNSLFAPYLSGRALVLLLEHKIIDAETEGDRVLALKARSLQSGRELILHAPYFIDATELGDLLPLTGTEFVTGAESQRDTGEPHAPAEAAPHNHQAFTFCFAMDHIAGEEHVIDKPAEYNFWRDFVPNLTPPWPGKLLDFTYTHPPTGLPRRLGFNPEGDTPGAVNLWTYRRIADRRNFESGTYPGDISLVNWPQNDYLLGNLIGVDETELTRHLNRARQLSLSLLYWLQTEAPRPDGKTGFPGLRLRADILGTDDGLAKYPYVRESRRIRAMFTVVEQHVSAAERARLKSKAAEPFFDSVGVGSYPVDLHPSTGGDNYIDFPSLPFQIPLGALLPVRITNLLPACKNIGSTHITNGCYRLHPVEWNIGESAGLLIVHALGKKRSLHPIRENRSFLADFQSWIRDQGVQTAWSA